MKLKNKIAQLIYFLLFIFRSLFFTPLAYAKGEDVIGEISPPEWIKKHGSVEVEANFGLINFISNILRLVTVVAGLFTVFNLLLAGISHISASGEPEKVKNAMDKIWNSLIGLIIIAASYTIAALLGWIIFGDASAIISPKIWGPGD